MNLLCDQDQDEELLTVGEARLFLFFFRGTRQMKREASSIYICTEREREREIMKF